MKKNEKISIIIPIYNSEKFINKCLDTVINQTYKNIEIICINDGSQDNSLNILKQYKTKDNRIKIIDKLNEGVSAARNDGLKEAKGDYITFVDADDWLELDAIEILYNTLQKQKVDVVRGNYYINNTYDDCNKKETGRLYNLSNTKLYTNDSDFAQQVIDRLLNGSLPCYIWLLLIKKKFLQGISFKEDIKIMEDKIFYNELLNKINSIYFLDKPLYHYYDNAESCTRSSEYYIRNMYNIIEVNKYLNNIIRNENFYSKERIDILNTTHLTIIMEYFYVMYKKTLANKNEIIDGINKILANKEVQLIIKNSNIKILPLRLKKTIQYIINKQYNKLFMFYRIRKFANKILNQYIKKSK